MGRERHIARGVRAGGDLIGIGGGRGCVRGVVVEDLVHRKCLVAELQHELEAFDQILFRLV